MKDTYILYPIGIIRKDQQSIRIEIKAAYAGALLGLSGFSHIQVFFWFDQNDSDDRRKTLQVHPRKNPKNPLTGVFATHAPVRPNLIGVTRCKILGVADAVVFVEDIDAFDGSPVIDIKGWIPDKQRADDDIRVPAWV